MDTVTRALPVDWTIVNEGGSRNVATLAWKLGVGRVLAISSVAAFGGSPDDGSSAAEGAPRREPPTAYSASKRAGEEAMREEVRRGLRLNVVYPSLVYGPPGKASGANSLLRSLARGGFPVLVGADRLASLVFVDDLIAGLVQVLERAAPGRDYLLAGEVVTIRGLARRVCALAGRRPPRREVPVGVARALLVLARPLVRLVGGRLPVSPEMLRNLSRHWAFDDSRAREELAWQPRGLAEGLPATLAAFGLLAAEAPA
jgi:dihydroflavonol-4-reductase